ncbi:MAG: hypothetical protein Q9M37_09215, partial [Desulfonauticus sp.]|nr:hypothetical protein [Desulfonauticus sp.]
GRVFAVLKGALDSGIHIPHNEEKLPDTKRISGEHIAEYAKILTATPEVYQLKFSKYLEQKLSPENLPKHFAKVKQKIMGTLKDGGKKK